MSLDVLWVQERRGIQHRRPGGAIQHRVRVWILWNSPTFHEEIDRFLGGLQAAPRRTDLLHIVSCHIMSYHVTLHRYIMLYLTKVSSGASASKSGSDKMQKMSLICQPCSFLFHSFCSLRFKSSVLQAMQRCKCFWWPEAQKSGAMIRTWVWEAREARKLRGSTERARFAQICTLTHRNCASPDQFSVMGSMIGSDSAAPVSEIMSLHVRCVNSGRGTQAWC